MSIPTLTTLVALLLAAAALVQPLAARARLPLAVMLAAGGLVLAGSAQFLLGIGSQLPVPEGLRDLSVALLNLPISPDIFLHLLLPILLFQGAMGLDIRHLARDASAVVVLAIGAVLLSIAVIGGAVHLATGLDLTLALLLGAIVATTDPSAVISLFRELGAPRRLTRLIEGESLLNDATAIAAFTALSAAAISGAALSPLNIGGQIALSLAGGALLGIFGGLGWALLMGRLGGWRSAQMTLTLALPYLVFSIGAARPEISGVVAVVSAGITLGTLGRARFSRESQRFLGELLDQTADWATGLIFLFGALIVPDLLGAATFSDLLAVGTVALAALAARAMILWGVVPLLARLRLMEAISPAKSTALLWGGLRGAMTLALALAVAQNTALPEETRRMIAVAATGYTLFTLFIQGTTLRLLIRALGLDRLSPSDLALRGQALSEALQRTRESVQGFSRRAGLGPDLVEEALAPYETRLTKAGSNTLYEEDIPDLDKLRLGLQALVNRERDMLLEQRWSPGLPPRLASRYLFTLDRMRDETQARGRVGYLGAARAPFLETPGFRLAAFLHRRTGWQGPLATHLARQFHQMLVTRLLILQLQRFLDSRLRPVFGTRIGGILSEILDRRIEELTRHMDAIELQYPGFARALRLSMVERFAYQEETRNVQQMAQSGIIPGEIATSLTAEAGHLHRTMRRPGRVDIAPPRPDLLRGLRAFSDFADTQLKRAAALLSPVVVAADTVIYRPGDRVDSIYFIASGAVEVRRKGCDAVRLGRGQAFGQLRVLNPDLAPAEVRALSYSHLYRMSVHDFREFLRATPAWTDRMAGLHKPLPAGE